MKHLLRRLSRVSPSSSSAPTSYSLLRSHTNRHRGRSRSSSSVAPEGHVPVYVGDEMERFVVSAELLHHPIFLELLDRSAQEYGYEQKGVLRIPCAAFLFRRVLDAVRFGDEPRDLEELLRRHAFDDKDSCTAPSSASASASASSPAAVMVSM